MTDAKIEITDTDLKHMHHALGHPKGCSTEPAIISALGLSRRRRFGLKRSAAGTLCITSTGLARKLWAKWLDAR